jgi:hypothetical protein
LLSEALFCLVILAVRVLPRTSTVTMTSPKVLVVTTGVATTLDSRPVADPGGSGVTAGEILIGLPVSFSKTS